jgi:uncharacterized protein (DUF1684 family)
MRHFAAALLLAAIVEPQAPAAPARAAATALFERLTGEWTGSGTILGQASTVEMQWTPALSGRFVRLTFASHIGPAPKTQHFEGHAYYEVRPDGRVRATWFDSSGQTRPIDATVDAATLVAAWGTPETEVGETTYRLVSDRALEVVDRVRGKDGTWRTFGRSTLSRTLPPR